MSAKYIVFNCDGLEMPVIFPEKVAHKEMALITEFNGPCQAVSAGFFRLEKGRVITEGESNGLNLKPRPQDAEILEKIILDK